jgi:cold-inducible RNA-binding protein
MKLFIAGLREDFDTTDLKEMFELYGEVKYAQVISDRVTKKSKGFGFVDMVSDEDAKETIRLLNGVKMMGKKLVVQKSE